MRRALNIRDILLLIALVGLAIGLVLPTTQAYAYSGGRYYGGHYYGGYGGHYGRSYGHYRYRPYYYGGNYSVGRYGRSYGHYRYRPYYYGRRHGGYYGGYPGGLVYGLLSVPRTVLGTVFGHHHSPSHHGGAYRGGSTAPPATGPSDPGAYRGGSTTPPATNPTNPGASNNTNSGSVYRGGWARLADGHYSRALSIFAAETGSNPTNGGPKVGYALSAAAGGDLRRGVWAMRRALRIDPDSMHYVTVDEPLRRRVEYLVTQYQNNPGNTLDATESAFMLASLHYLLRDIASARTAIDVAVANGERSPSTTNLARLIDGGLTPEKQHAAGAELAPSQDVGSQSPSDY